MLIIGSTVCDVMIYLIVCRVEEMPILITNSRSVEAVHLMSSIFFIFCQNYQFVSPVGSGTYGDFIRRELKQLGISSSISLEDQWVLLLLVESDG